MHLFLHLWYSYIYFQHFPIYVYYSTLFLHLILFLRCHIHQLHQNYKLQKQRVLHSTFTVVGVKGGSGVLIYI